MKEFDPAVLCDPNELLGGFFNASSLGFGVLDKQFRYRAVNRSLAAMNGVAARAHLGKTVRDVLGEIAVTLEAPLRHVLFSGREVNLEFWAKLLKRNEAGYWFVNYFPIRDVAGRVELVGAVVLENSRQKSGQDFLSAVTDRLIRNLLSTAHDSDALVRVITEFLKQTPDSRTNSERPAFVRFINQLSRFSNQGREEAFHGRSERAVNASTSAPVLTPRERDVVKLLVDGAGNKETASILGVSVKTVESHRATIMLKLGLHSTRELVHYAITNKTADQEG